MNCKNLEAAVTELDSFITQLQSVREQLVTIDTALPVLLRAKPVASAAVPPPLRPPRTRKPGLPSLDVQAKGKPGRKPKPVQTPAAAKASVQALLHGGGDPATFSGACKRVMRESEAPLTVAEIYTLVQAAWPALCDGKDASNVMANLTYAAAQNKCEKLGRGEQATFRILDAEYFKESEA